VNVLLISDVHSNLLALETVLEACGPVDAIWNLGDTVGYGPRPNECISLLQEKSVNLWLAGNHDLAALDQRRLSGFNPVAALAARWTGDQLTEEHQRFLSQLSPITEEHGYLLAHGSPRDPISEYIFGASEATANLRLLAGQICFVGHTHFPIIAAPGPDGELATVRLLTDGEAVHLGNAGPLILNPGSVGQPRDGDRRASFGILDLGSQIFTLRRVEYDIRATQKAMREAGLPDQLVSRLENGR
jgi:diadenosine tetraphosphatase ApaH/serine/threonine PP2A family protein phosphatase